MHSRLLGIGLFALAIGVAGCGGDGDGDSDGGGATSGSSIADATAVAEALDCADTFQATDATPMMGPAPDSAGSCDAEGGVSIEVYGTADDVEEIVGDFPTVGCSILQGFGIEQFTTVAGENWMVSVMDDTDGAASERIASVLGGEVHEFDCS
jgi:hypothetical protein